MILNKTIENLRDNKMFIVVNWDTKSSECIGTFDECSDYYHYFQYHGKVKVGDKFVTNFFPDIPHLNHREYVTVVKYDRINHKVHYKYDNTQTESVMGYFEFFSMFNKVIYGKL